MPRRALRATLFRLLRDRRGATAVEFGAVALPFFAMMFAILEVAMVFTVDSVLENATIETGRLVRTGQATAQNMTKEKFKEELCRRMSVFSQDCATRAKVDVREIPQFAQPPQDPMLDGKVEDGELSYSNGAPGSIMLVRVFYEQPVLALLFVTEGVDRPTRNSAVLTATSAFRNEPV